MTSAREPHSRRSHRRVAASPAALVALAALVASGARAGARASSAAERFIALLKEPGKAPARQEAWARIKEAGEPPAAVLKAIATSRSRAWAALERLMRSSQAREAARGLRAKIAPHQGRVRAVVGGNAFSREALDRAAEPISKALEEAIAPLGRLEAFKRLSERIDELEGYAADCGLRHGWEGELGTALVRVVFVNLYAGSGRWRTTLERNRRVGAWIEPGEASCVAHLNIHRILIGLHPLTIDLRLVVAAKKHSEEMAAKGYFSHESPTPRWRTFTQRATREHTRAGGECIAAGTTSGAGAFRMWYYSQGHHRIMISGAKNIGVGRCGNKWTTSGTTYAEMTHYVRERYQAGDDPARLLALAKWCASVGLLEQCADELRRLLASEPDNAEAKRALPRLEAKGY